MDWSEVAKLPRREQTRAWVQNWKRTGPELERQKRAELRDMTEEQAGDIAATLAQSAADELWTDPERHSAAGLIEQQRLFAKLRSRS